jgi:hypothetical protein
MGILKRLSLGWVKMVNTQLLLLLFLGNKNHMNQQNQFEFAGENKPTKIRTITGTFKYCNSGTQEVKTVTCLFDERSEKYELTMVYVVEFGYKLAFSKSDNEFLVND